MNRLSLAIVLALSTGFAQAQQGDGTNVAIEAHVTKPGLVEATPARVAQLKAPAGFAVTVFAAGLKNARMLAVAPDGTIYVSRRDQGDVVMLRDADQDGKADGTPLIVAHRAGAHGLAIHEGKLYIATVKEVFVADLLPDGLLGPLTMIIGDLPDSGQHPNRTIAFGPDGKLYISVGSTCNACNESNPENATILQASPDGKSRTIFASGLRNTIGFAWEPNTGELWGMDHGIDYLGDDQQPEELNLIQRGKQYGWPHVYATAGINPQTTPSGGITKEEWKAISTPMALGYTAHAAPMQMLFYSGNAFPNESRGDAFLALRGSWNRKQPSGYEIARIQYRDGKPMAITPFVTGFLTPGGKTHFARPVGLAQLNDGSLLMSDDANGVLYRVAYKKTSGAAVTSEAGPAPATAMIEQSSKGIGVPLTLERPEARADGSIAITSGSIASEGSIPSRHSEYADGVSPSLTWTAIPGAKSYALIMEDPDSKPITPFVHWVAWNIPATVTSLPEGLQEQMRLTDPEGLMQGTTSRGSVGYFGPRPPAGDPPHHYHFQILALDTLLDVKPGASRDELLAAAKGHVIATGNLIGTFQQVTAPQK